MTFDAPQIIEFVLTGGENRRQEMKESISWKDEITRFKITKAILAMSNIANGGRIIIGIVDNNGKYDDKTLPTMEQVQKNLLVINRGGPTILMTSGSAQNGCIYYQ